MYHFISVSQPAVPTFILSLHPYLPQCFHHSLPPLSFFFLFNTFPSLTVNSYYTRPSSTAASASIFPVLIPPSLHTISLVFKSGQIDTFAVSLWLYKQRHIGLSELPTCLHTCKNKKTFVACT